MAHPSLLKKKITLLGFQAQTYLGFFMVNQTREPSPFSFFFFHQFFYVNICEYPLSYFFLNCLV